VRFVYVCQSYPRVVTQIFYSPQLALVMLLFLNQWQTTLTCFN